LAGLAAFVAAVNGTLGILGLPQYLFPTLIASPFIVLIAFLCWLLRYGRPEEGSGRHTSLRSRALPGIAIPAVVALGILAVRAVSPTHQPEVIALRRLVANVDRQRNRLRDPTGPRLAIYRRYHAARLAGGPGFWDNVTLAMQVAAAQASEHDQLLRPVIGDPLVPEALLQGREPRAMSWIPGGALREQVARVIGYFAWADDSRARIQQAALNATGHLLGAEALNDEICRYYELVLLDSATYLTQDRPKDIAMAELAMRRWLSHQD